MHLEGETGLWGSWPVSNRYGARSTLNLAIQLYDPFQALK